MFAIVYVNVLHGTLLFQTSRENSAVSGTERPLCIMQCINEHTVACVPQLS